MEFSKKIRQLRFRSSLTQEQLAERLSLSPQAVSKWETGAAMPDISLLPDLAEVFGVSIDELFDLTAEQKMRRIESRMDREEEIDADVFREYEEFLKEKAEGRGAGDPKERRQALSLLAHLYHHRLTSDANRVSRLAREAIRLAPEKKDCQWLLQRAEGDVIWDWNAGNHSRTIDFYKEVIAGDKVEPKTPLPYYYLLDELIADHRTEEAEYYLSALKTVPAHRPLLIPVYEANIALAEYDEPRADAIMEKAMAEFSGECDFLFEAAQYYARKGDYEKALEYYEASYAADGGHKPRYTDALQGIAMIHEIRGEYQEAADTWRRVLDSLKNEWGFTEETVVRETEQEIQRLEEKSKRR